MISWLISSCGWCSVNNLRIKWSKHDLRSVSNYWTGGSEQTGHRTVPSVSEKTVEDPADIFKEIKNATFQLLDQTAWCLLTLHGSRNHLELFQVCSRRKQKEEDEEEPTVSTGELLLAGTKPLLQVSQPVLDVTHVEVCVSREVLADWGVGVTQSTVQGGAAHTDHYSDQTEQEEEEAGVPTADLYRREEERLMSEASSDWTDETTICGSVDTQPQNHCSNDHWLIIILYNLDRHHQRL